MCEWPWILSRRVGADRAASRGARVAVIEEGRLGGTCVNVSC